LFPAPQILTLNHVTDIAVHSYMSENAADLWSCAESSRGCRC